MNGCLRTMDGCHCSGNPCAALSHRVTMLLHARILCASLIHVQHACSTSICDIVLRPSFAVINHDIHLYHVAKVAINGHPSNSFNNTGHEFRPDARANQLCSIHAACNAAFTNSWAACLGCVYICACMMQQRMCILACTTTTLKHIAQLSSAVDA